MVENLRAKFEKHCFKAKEHRHLPMAKRTEGEFKDGEAHGQGTLTFANGETYEGEFKDGEAHGQGTLTFINGNRYVGEFSNGVRHGQGTLTYKSPVDVKLSSGLSESFSGTYSGISVKATWKNGTTIAATIESAKSEQKDLYALVKSNSRIMVILH